MVSLFAQVRAYRWMAALACITAVAVVNGSVATLPAISRTAPDVHDHQSSAVSTPPSTGFVLGRVLDATTGQPISGAQVTLTKLTDSRGSSAVGIASAQPTPATPKAVITANDGALLFRDLTAGRYSLTVTAFGYLPGGYRRGGPTDTRIHSLELKDGERRTDIEVRLWKLGSIWGVVVDEAGRPASGAQVTVLRRGYSAGRFSLIRAATITTNDRGMYVARGLPPAEYVVGIRARQLSIPVSLSERYAAALAAWPDPRRSPPMTLELLSSGVTSPGATGYRLGNWIRQVSDIASVGYTPPPPEPDGRVLSYGSTYYASADSPITATSIILAAGEDRRGVDLALKLAQGFRVSGRLVGPDGPVKDLGVRLLPTGTEALVPDRGFEEAVTVSDANGAFTFLGVLPGTYQLRATRLPLAPTVPGKPAGAVWWAVQAITVDRDDINDVTVPVRAGLKITGRFQFLGAAPPPLRMPDITIGLRAVGAEVMEREAMNIVPAEGMFTTNGDVPGRYFIEVWAPRGWWVRSITYAGRNVADEPFDLNSADANDVVVTFTDVLTRLSGTVTSDKGEPDSHASVLVFPADSDGWRRGDFNIRRSRRLITMTDGTFTFQDIPAGIYNVVAVNDAAAIQWTNPEVLEKLVTGASRVTIVEGDNKNVALKSFVVK